MTMMVETTAAEQQQYLCSEDNSEPRLTALTPVMPGSKEHNSGRRILP